MHRAGRDGLRRNAALALAGGSRGEPQRAGGAGLRPLAGGGRRGRLGTAPARGVREIPD